MLRLRYQTLCSIAFRHEYYRDGISRDFLLMPTTTTQQLMESYGLLVRPTSSRVLVVQKMDSGVPEIPFTKPICLTFLIQLTNMALYSVSKIADKRRFFFTNIDALGAYKANLTQKSTLTHEDALMPLRSQQFNLAIPKGTLQQIVLSRTELGGIKNLPSLSIEAAMENVDIKLKNAGKYTLVKLPTNSKEVFYANADLRNTPNLFGIMELWLDQNFVSGLQYNIQIEARRFIWQYYLTDLASNEVVFEDATDISVKYNRNGHIVLPETVQFVSKEPLNISQNSFKVMQDIAKGNNNIKKVMLFESDQNIPVLESRAPTIEMTILNNTAVKPKLPVPELSNLNIRLSPIRDPEDPDDPLAYAMMFYSV
jgi:hypothetical protein